MSPGVTVEVDVDEKADWPYLGFLSVGDWFLLDGFVYEVVDRGPVFPCRRVLTSLALWLILLWTPRC